MSAKKTSGLSKPAAPPKHIVPPKQGKVIQRSLVVFFLLLLGGAVSLGVLSLFGPKPPQLPTEEVTELETPLPDTDTHQQVRVYFSQQAGNVIVTKPVHRWMSKDYEPIATEWALEQQLKGPTSRESKQGFYSEIPKGTRLLGVTETPKSVIINLSKEFATSGGSNSQQQRWQELANTIKGLGYKKSLAVQINGKPLTALSGEGLEPSFNEAADLKAAKRADKLVDAKHAAQLKLQRDAMLDVRAVKARPEEPPLEVKYHAESER